MNYEHNEVGRPSWRMLVEGVSTADLERAKIIADNHKMVNSYRRINHSLTIDVQCIIFSDNAQIGLH